MLGMEGLSEVLALFSEERAGIPGSVAALSKAAMDALMVVFMTDGVSGGPDFAKGLDALLAALRDKSHPDVRKVPFMMQQGLFVIVNNMAKQKEAYLEQVREAAGSSSTSNAA